MKSIYGLSSTEPLVDMPQERNTARCIIDLGAKQSLLWDCVNRVSESASTLLKPCKIISNKQLTIIFCNFNNVNGCSASVQVKTSNFAFCEDLSWLWVRGSASRRAAVPPPLQGRVIPSTNNSNGVGYVIFLNNKKLANPSEWDRERKLAPIGRPRSVLFVSCPAIASRKLHRKRYETHVAIEMSNCESMTSKPKQSEFFCFFVIND